MTPILRYVDDQTLTLITAPEASEQTFTSWTSLAAHLAQPCVILLPGEQVTTTELTLPKTSAAERAQAIPYALEEQLAAPLDETYFVTGRQSAEGKVPVAIVDKAYLAHLHEQCIAHHIIPLAVLPDYLALPIESDEWVAWVDEDRVLLKKSATQGLSCARDNLDTLLALTTSHPKTLRLISNTHTPFTPTLPGDMTLKIDTNDVAYPWSHAAITHPPYHFMQGAFRLKTAPSSLTRRWKWVAYALGVMCVTWFGTQLGALFILQNQNKKMAQHIQRAYQSVFPNQTPSDSVRTDLTQRLQRLESIARNGQFFTYLTQIAPTLKTSSDLTLIEIHYSDRALTLVLSAETEAALTAFQKQLSQKGVPIQRGKTDKTQQAIQATFTLGGKS